MSNTSNTTGGRVWKFGDDINTDLIFPNVAFIKPATEQPAYCFSANRPGWSGEVQPGDLIVGGRNFATGSGRAIGRIFAGLKIAGILAETVNGLGMRNCINFGIPVLPAPGVAGFFEEGDIAEVDWAGGEIKNLTQGTSMKGNPLPEALRDIADAGGVMPILIKEGFFEPPGG